MKRIQVNFLSHKTLLSVHWLGYGAFPTGLESLPLTTREKAKGKEGIDLTAALCEDDRS